MKNLNKYPLARMLFPLIGGILFAPILSIKLNIVILIITILVFLFSLWIFASKKYRNHTHRWFSGFLISALFFLLGIGITLLNFPLQRVDNYRNFKEPKAYTIEIASSFSETEKNYKCLGNIKTVVLEKDSSWIASQGKILLYFQKQDDFSLHYGDQILTTAQLVPIQGAQNPYAFDYAKYMQRKGIFDQCFIKDQEWKLVKTNHEFSVQSLAIRLRTKLLTILNDLNYDKENLALAAALLIGYDEYLDDNLRSKFAGSGAMHILCVSGLHVGIIYMLSNFLLGFLGRIKWGNLLKNALILALIWFYALLTGLSPSVMRAATMFSFILFGNTLKRNGNTYNSLAASALLLLLLDSNLIYNIGFQLSYSAVFAILFIQPKIAQFIHFKYDVLNKVCDLIAVSIAAQIGTFPLAIYYFHQFPNYFLLTNLWVIPLAFIIVSTGMLVLMIGIVGISGTILGKIAAYLLNLSLLSLNKGVDIINQLPYAINDNLLFTSFEVLIVYILLFSLVKLLLYKKRIWLSPFLIAVFLLIGSSIYINSASLRTSSWVVYKTNGYSAMDFISEQKSTLIGDSSFIQNSQAKKFVIKENHINNRIKENVFAYRFQKDSAFAITTSQNIILFDSLRILYVDSNPKEFTVEKPMDIDYIVIAKNAKVKWSQLQNQYTFKSVIFDSSNDWWRIKQLKFDADAIDLPYWDVNERGAFVLNIKKPAEIQQVFKNGSF